MEDRWKKKDMIGCGGWTSRRKENNYVPDSLIALATHLSESILRVNVEMEVKNCVKKAQIKYKPWSLTLLFLYRKFALLSSLLPNTSHTHLLYFKPNV